jgi:hypothetical protein
MSFNSFPMLAIAASTTLHRLAISPAASQCFCASSSSFGIERITACIQPSDEGAARIPCAAQPTVNAAISSDAVPSNEKGPPLSRRALKDSSGFTAITDSEIPHPHFDSPQFRQVLHPSIITTAAVLHLLHSCAPSGKCDFENASVCFCRASNSARFSSIIFF